MENLKQKKVMGKIWSWQRSVEPKVRLQGYGFNPLCSHSSRCLAVLVWQYFEEAFCAPKVRLKWYGFKGSPSHSSHCSRGLFPQYSGVSPKKVTALSCSRSQVPETQAMVKLNSLGFKAPRCNAETQNYGEVGGRRCHCCLWAQACRHNKRPNEGKQSGNNAPVVCNMQTRLHRKAGNC